MKKEKREEKPLTCYNCGGKGHTSMQCPSEAFFGTIRGSDCFRGGKKPVRPQFSCEGFLEGHSVNDIVLDMGCSRTLVRSGLMREKSYSLKKTVGVQCSHGDVVKYPVSTVEISIQGKVVLVEVAVVDKLPHSVLLRTDAPVLVELIEGKEKAFLVTQTQACKLKRSQFEQSREENGGTSSDSGEVVELTMSGDKGAEGKVELGSQPQSKSLDLMEPSEQDDVLVNVFNFTEDVFVGGERVKEQKSRSEKRKSRYDHAKVQRTGEGEINLTREESRKLQDDDQTIQDLRKKKPDQVVEREGLWYHLWAERAVEQLLLPKFYHEVVCKLAHSVPMAGNLGRDKSNTAVLLAQCVP